MVSEETPGDGEPAPDDEVQQEAMDIEAVKVGTVALSFSTCYVADSCRNKCGGQRRKGCVLAGLIAKNYWGGKLTPKNYWGGKLTLEN